MYAHYLATDRQVVKCLSPNKYTKYGEILHSEILHTHTHVRNSLQLAVEVSP